MKIMHEEERVLDPNVAEARRHARAARREWRRSWEGLLPAGFVEHRRAARREMLLALRSLVNAAIDHMEEDKGPYL